MAKGGHLNRGLPWTTCVYLPEKTYQAQIFDHSKYLSPVCICIIK